MPDTPGSAQVVEEDEEFHGGAELGAGASRHKRQRLVSGRARSQEGPACMHASVGSAAGVQLQGALAGSAVLG